jgi:hypothetical protein
LPSTKPSNHTPPDDLIILDGELTSGSTLIFYTGQQVHLVNGRVNGLWYGSFWPDAPHIFETEATLRQLWASPRRIFLFTYNPDRPHPGPRLPFGSVHTLATAGGKTILTTTIAQPATTAPAPHVPLSNPHSRPISPNGMANVSPLPKCPHGRDRRVLCIHRKLVAKD